MTSCPDLSSGSSSASTRHPRSVSYAPFWLTVTEPPSLPLTFSRTLTENRVLPHGLSEPTPVTPTRSSTRPTKTLSEKPTRSLSSEAEKAWSTMGPPSHSSGGASSRVASVVAAMSRYSGEGGPWSAHPPRAVPKMAPTASTRKRSITGPSYPYSPECVEGVFSELRREGVLGSWLPNKRLGPAEMPLLECGPGGSRLATLGEANRGQEQGRVPAARGEDPGGPAGRPPGRAQVRGRPRPRPPRAAA